MGVTETIKQLALALEAALIVRTRIMALLRSLKRHSKETSYENISLSLTLDIHDTKGRYASIIREQKVQFLAGESGVITNPIWGEGNLLGALEVSGATLMASRIEGSRRVLLLALDRRTIKGRRVTIRSRRLVKRAFTRSREYLEAFIERPTRQLNLRVLFPKSRPPKDAHFVSTPCRSPDGEVRVTTSTGRPSLSKRIRNVSPETTYSLRWSW
jgi:hypothetical protein